MMQKYEQQFFCEMDIILISFKSYVFKAYEQSIFERKSQIIKG